VNRRQYLAGTGVLVSSGAIGATETGRAHENNDSSNRTGEETDGGQRPATRTVLHLSSDDVAEQEMALMNAKNLLEDPTVDNREIRFVANMRAIFAYVEGESEHADLVRSSRSRASSSRRVKTPWRRSTSRSPNSFRLSTRSPPQSGRRQAPGGRVRVSEGPVSGSVGRRDRSRRSDVRVVLRRRLRLQDDGFASGNVGTGVNLRRLRSRVSEFR